LKENEGRDLAGDERTDGWMVIWCLFDTFVGIFGVWSYMLALFALCCLLYRIDQTYLVPDIEKRPLFSSSSIFSFLFKSQPLSPYII
jgi:hypothetical protein